MTVAELIAALQEMPQDAVVYVVDDMGPPYEATEVEAVPCHLAPNGTVRVDDHLEYYGLQANCTGVRIT